MLTVRGIIQGVAAAVGFLAGHDLVTEVGLNWQTPAFWGNLFGVLSSFGLSFGLAKDQFVKLITFGLAAVKKWDESKLPNGSTARMNWIVDGLQAGVPPETLKPTYDQEWETIVRECVQKQEAHG